MNLTETFFENYDEFVRFLDKTDSTFEFNYFGQNETDLSVGLYLDDCRSYERNKHPLFMLFVDGMGKDDNVVPVLVSDDPKIMIRNYDVKISENELNTVFQFIKINKKLIEDLANEKINDVDFVMEMRNNKKDGK